MNADRVAATAGAFVLLTVLWIAHSHLQSSPIPSATESKVEHALADSSTVLQSFAWQTLANLTDPSVAAGFPDWEINWKAKCEIGLEYPSCVGDNSTAPFRLNLKDDQRRKFDSILPGIDPSEHMWHSLRLPLQLTRPESGAGTRKPSFAQVLFNTIAADAVTNYNIAALRKNQSMPDFPPGSMIAKTDWKFLPVYPTSVGSPVLQTSDAASLDVSKVVGLPGNPDEGWTPKSPAFLPAPNGAPPFWLSKNVTTASDGSDCTGPLASPLISTDCLHAYQISPRFPPHVVKAQNGRNSLQVAAARAALITACGNNPCVEVLRGIHIMVRLCPTSPLYDPKKPWVFMTFWWTGYKNSSDSTLKGAWNYFQVNVTQNPRDDNAPPGSKNICFNPYLEGTSYPAGASVNCITCHKFAVYNQKDLMESKRDDGNCLGNQPVGQTSHCDETPKKYFLGTTTTDLVWSMANLNTFSSP